MDYDVVTTEPAIVEEFQFVSEVASLDVKVEDLCVADQDREGPLGERDCALS